MRVLAKIVVGALEALVGAYVGAILLVLVAASLTAVPVPDTPREALGWRTVIQLVTIPLAGVAGLAWWITPVGAAFNLMLKPRIRNWVKSTALLKGGLVGLGLGLVTAIFLVLTGSGIPPRTLQIAFVFLPVYCSVWCALYARGAATGPHTSHEP